MPALYPKIPNLLISSSLSVTAFGTWKSISATQRGSTSSGFPFSTGKSYFELNKQDTYVADAFNSYKLTLKPGLAEFINTTANTVVTSDGEILTIHAVLKTIDGISGAAVFSVGSDGTDGPTDAAGGYVDYTTAAELKAQGIEIFDVLKQNDAFHALQKVGGLVYTGPTGTNVNDVAVALLKAE